MPLARLDAPFEHPDWIFEPKMDGFRAVAYVEGGACRFVSRNRNAFKTFEPLAQAIALDLSGRSSILYGECRAALNREFLKGNLLRRPRHRLATGRMEPLAEILFYDGHCSLCHRSVQFVVRHDRDGTAFRFAPMQWPTFWGYASRKGCRTAW
jgi:hypothetical protein